MMSKSIDDIEVYFELESSLIELYSELHATGCFTCSTSISAHVADPDDYADSNSRVDICEPTSKWSLTGAEWSKTFDMSSDSD